MKLHNDIEALLFISGEPISINKLTKILKISKKEVEEALLNLEESLKERGLSLIKFQESVSLTTSSSTAKIVSEFLQAELQSKLSRAALETLTIILYKGPATRAVIDYIRGVNSTYTLHNLLMRGLIERIINPKDSRSFLYKPSNEFLKHTGITSLKELPEYENMRDMKKKEIKEILETKKLEDYD